MDKKTEEFYVRLKEELDNTTEWPSDYLFKFIVPTDDAKVALVEGAFDQMGAVIETRQSKNGAYTSISVNVRLQNSQQVIDKYLQVAPIEGIISL